MNSARSEASESEESEELAAQYFWYMMGERQSVKIAVFVAFAAAASWVGVRVLAPLASDAVVRVIVREGVCGIVVGGGREGLSG